MEYMTVREAGDQWGLGIRMVTLYCTEGRIDGAVKKGNMWLIPKNAVKPADGRRKIAPVQEEGITEQNEWPFQSLYENKDLFAEIVKRFPYPMHICAADGTMLLANDAFLEFARISNPEKLYKKQNVAQDPVLEEWGVKDFVAKAYRGEVVHAYDVKVPYQEIVERLGHSRELVSGSIYHNMTAFPICDDGNRLQYIVTVFMTSRHYQGRDEIMKGKEYIEDHWKEEFDADKLADIVHMSRYHYARLFKRHTGMTPFTFYQRVKIEKIKEKLCDDNLSVAQAFAECGADYNGNYAKVFKRKTGLTPSQYRAENTRF
ncbi:helix-turn-helix domain-containing protein [Bacillota bacterium Meth-B3]|nr:helix-turn-helix domain-containing protein [Christensenellaceae bacterium]MEA5069191.1 helix-turn-helix domain-containing protein [Christensenellaceae bacterium]